MQQSKLRFKAQLEYDWGEKKKKKFKNTLHEEGKLSSGVSSLSV